MNTQRPRRIAFLLAQLGADASAAFESALLPLGLTMSEAGLMRLVGLNPGISQKKASEHLGVGPSRVVSVLDRLEHRGHLERRPSKIDRRSHELHLTPEGEKVLAELRPIAKAHEAAFTQGLDESELDQLAASLDAIATTRGLSRDVHANTRASTDNSPKP